MITDPAYADENLPQWLRGLRVQGIHVHSWCPFCYLGWRRDPAAGQAGYCCAVDTPLRGYDMHVPAMPLFVEDPAFMVQFMLYPKPWQAAQLAKAGMMGRKIVKGLAHWLECDKCDQCRALRKTFGEPYARCMAHDGGPVPVDADAVGS